jgi:hypothetical protein
LFYDTAEGSIGGVHYPADRISQQTMDRFSRCLLELIEAFIRQPQARVASIALAS